MDQKKKNKKTRVLSVLLLLALLITGAFAFLTAQDSKTNKFTVGKIKMEVCEYFDADGDGIPEEFDGSEKNPTLSGNVTPGDSVLKQPFVRNIGKNDMYAYILIGNPQVDVVSEVGGVTNHNMTAAYTYTIDSTNWEDVYPGQTLSSSAMDDTNEYKLYRYTGNGTPLVKAATNDSEDDQTAVLFDKVTLKEQFTSKDLNAYDNLNITVIGYGIQAEGDVNTSDLGWGQLSNAVEFDSLYTLNSATA